MKKPGSANSDNELRGDYTAAGRDYVVPQDWDTYTPEMHDRWRRLHQRQSALAEKYASPQFLEGLGKLDCSYGVPRFEYANLVLGNATGWQLVAVPGFIPDAVFFDHLANRRFPVTRWLREESELDYLVEPDIFHDFFGHVPMLLDPHVADFLALYGKAGERAMEMDALPMLARIYWYTIEFGLIDTRHGLKAFGAGIVSSAGETVFSVTDPEVLRLNFDPVRIMNTAYKIDDFQANYFVLDSLKQLLSELVSLDFGPIYETWRDKAPIPAGTLRDGEKPWQGQLARKES
ncbi:phenylalanine 4-monooxygenase [Croceicoccus naphthovorans]|uniref:Phenylalanine-4-hydroxylase n=1 Tax=Croceicoccus naphthovorans TaxID=1348774 RepID=A0A0G3XJ68_9SPHN|nr:phenylalanine 4-monooxygenase [Croceicoccus naphthovorans]AKM10644.1 phenylalanine-4-hydroxylase [Croceicoccus naphthovorans]MBB3988876.1 phenylalanine-4-hydroxylase [Croceicoccus naphthovorans]